MAADSMVTAMRRGQSNENRSDTCLGKSKVEKEIHRKGAWPLSRYAENVVKMTLFHDAAL
jgi:hypothetical protein